MIHLPEEFVTDMKALLGEEFPAFLASYGEEPRRGLRLNTLKLRDAASLPFPLKPVPWCPPGFFYGAEHAPGRHIYHEMGLYYIQEPSAMSVAEALDIRPGDRVLDMCAAPGGKSTQAACRLQGQGLLVSNEIIPSRAKILSSNIERFGITNCVVLNEDCHRLTKPFRRFFNKIIVDAPCSGEGMFRKNPEAVTEWSRENVLMCRDRQKEILAMAEEMLQDNGSLVYSTCTFSREENEEVLQWFLDSYKDFELTACHRIFPHREEGEGHFYAVLRRGDGQGKPFVPQTASPRQNPEFVKFVKDALTIPLKYNVCFGDHLSLSPLTGLEGLKVQRCGLHLGTMKKNRFEPSHALALALKREDFRHVIDLKSDDPEAARFLEGGTLLTDVKGWGVVCVDGYPLGWFKGDGKTAKNHYPRGLRRSLRQE